MAESKTVKKPRTPLSFLWDDLLRCEDKKKACLYTLLGVVIVLLIGAGLMSLRDDLDRSVNILAPLFMGLVTVTGIANFLVLFFVRKKRWPSIVTGILSFLSLNITGGIYTLAIGASEIIRPEYSGQRGLAPQPGSATSLFVEERPVYNEGYDPENNVVVRVISKKKNAKPYQVKGIEDVSSKNNWKGWLYLAPVIILVAVFLIYPLVSTIFISFTETYNYQSGSFDGFTFRNFTYILGLTQKSATNTAREVYFTKYAIPNTFLLVVVTVPISTLLALIIAVALNSIKWFQKALQTVFFLPYVTNGIAVGMVFSVIFAKAGVINYLFHTNITWIFGAKPETAFIPLIIYIVWNSIPFKILIFLSGLQGIDKQYYHAAQIDAAPRWKVLWRVTVPLLSPQILYILITSFIGAFKEYTSIVGLFNGPGTMGAGDPNMETIVYYIYDNIDQPSIASAAAVFLFVIILAFTALQFAASKRRVHY